MKTFIVQLRIFRKGSMLNPEEGQVHKTLHHLGYTNVTRIKIAKCIIIDLEAESEDDIKAKVQKIAKNSQIINPVADVVEIGEIKTA
jgi:phosphoribosylformylglycinamidine synthase PurS subunit